MKLAEKGFSCITKRKLQFKIIFHRVFLAVEMKVELEEEQKVRQWQLMAVAVLFLRLVPLKIIF